MSEHYNKLTPQGFETDERIEPPITDAEWSDARSLLHGFLWPVLLGQVAVQADAVDERDIEPPKEEDEGVLIQALVLYRRGHQKHNTETDDA